MSHPAISPYDAYPTADGRLVPVSVQNDREWVKLAGGLLGRPGLTTDARFATNADRVTNRVAIDEMLGSVIAGLSALTAVAALTDCGIACAQVNSPSEVVDHPQLVQRGRWAEVEAPCGPVSLPLAHPVASAWETPTEPVPALGQHTDAILGELGLAPETIASMHADGVA